MAGLGRKVFTAGDVLTASDVQNYLMDQTTMVFASDAARSSAIATSTEGMLSVVTDIDEIDYYNGSAWVSALPVGAWTSFTPTLTAWAVGNGTYDSFYTQIGKTVIWRCKFTAGTTTTFVGSPVLTLPVTAKSGTLNQPFAVNLGAAGSIYPGLGYINTTTTVNFVAQNTAGTYAINATIAAAVPNTWASTNVISFVVVYEAA